MPHNIDASPQQEPIIHKEDRESFFLKRWDNLLRKEYVSYITAKLSPRLFTEPPDTQFSNNIQSAIETPYSSMGIIGLETSTSDMDGSPIQSLANQIILLNSIKKLKTPSSAPLLLVSAPEEPTHSFNQTNLEEKFIEPWQQLLYLAWAPQGQVTSERQSIEPAVPIQFNIFLPKKDIHNRLEELRSFSELIPQLIENLHPGLQRLNLPRQHALEIHQYDTNPATTDEARQLAYIIIPVL